MIQIEPIEKRFARWLREGCDGDDERNVSIVAEPMFSCSLENEIRLAQRLRGHEDAVLAMLEIGQIVVHDMLQSAGINGLTTGPVAVKTMKRWEKTVVDIMHGQNRRNARVDVAGNV